MMKRICLIGQFPPPIHGLSVALRTIVNSKFFNDKYELSCVDIKDNKRIAAHLNRVGSMEADIYYFTISQTKLGNMRDMFILWRLLRKKKKIVIHYHGGYYKELYRQFNPLQRWLNKKLLSQVDIMIVLSSGLQHLFEDVISSGKIRICENCIEDQTLLSESEFAGKLERLAKGKDDLDIVYMSNFIKSKGYYDLLEAARLLRGQRVKIHFAGKFFNDKDKEAFFTYVRDNGLDGIIHYYGVVAGEEKKRLLSQCDVFVLPTYYPNEGQPISIIEAMGNGLTVISTSHAGIPDIVSPSNGYLVKPQCPQEIAAAIEALNGERSRLLAYARENRRTTLTRFKESDYLRRLEIIMDEV